MRPEHRVPRPPPQNSLTCLPKSMKATHTPCSGCLSRRRSCRSIRYRKRSLPRCPATSPCRQRQNYKFLIPDSPRGRPRRASARHSLCERNPLSNSPPRKENRILIPYCFTQNYRDHLPLLCSARASRKAPTNAKNTHSIHPNSLRTRNKTQAQTNSPASTQKKKPQYQRLPRSKLLFSFCSLI